MHRIFLPIYHFFRRQKALMYVILAATTLLFAFYGSKLQLEEDIIKLLPRSATSNELAFSDISLAEKIFVQFTSADTLNPVSQTELCAGADAFSEQLQLSDTTTHYVESIFSSITIEDALGAMDFGLAHIPSFVDPAWYADFEAAMTPEAIAAQMEKNMEIIENDETGEDSQIVAMDPLNIRGLMQQKLLGDGSFGGMTISEGHLFSPDKTVAIVLISPAFNSTDSGTSTKLVRMMERTAAQVQENHPGVRILMHGNPIGSVSNASTIKRDLMWSISLSLLLILVIMLMSFHKLAFVWQQVVPVLYGALFALACMYWVKGVMSLMALGISAIVLGVAISYCLHMLIHFYYVKDPETTLREESTPVFLGCLTTIGAFMGLLFTESELLSDFGMFATFALIGNTLFALIFLPHMLNPRQITYKRQHGFPLVEKVNGLPWDRNKGFIIALTVVIIVGVIFSPKVKFDSDLKNLDYRNAKLEESLQLYNEKTADGYNHQYFAAWAEESLDEALVHNGNFSAYLDSLKATGLVHDYVPVTKLLLHSTATQQERILAWKKFFSPRRVSQLRQDLRAASIANGLPSDFCRPFISLVTGKYEPGDLVESGVVPPGMLSNYVEKQESGRYMVFTDVSYAPENQSELWKKLTSQDHVLVLEPFYYCRDMVEIVHDDFSTTLWISSIFVLLVLFFSFRNFWIALLAFFPMFISWYVMQGYMAILGLEFNLINIVISTFIYGIGVDYSIFVMEGLLAEARRGQTAMLVYHKVAIFYSALVLAIVTFSLIFARHPSIHSIGLITLIGMASTILITYSLQPWIFRKLAQIPFFRKGFGIPD